MSVWPKNYPAHLQHTAWEKREQALEKLLHKNFHLTQTLGHLHHTFVFWEGWQYLQDTAVPKNIKRAMEIGDPFLIDESLRAYEKRDLYLATLKKEMDAVKQKAGIIAKQIQPNIILTIIGNGYLQAMIKECDAFFAAIHKEIETSGALLWKAREELSKKLNSAHVGTH